MIHFQNTSTRYSAVVCSPRLVSLARLTPPQHLVRAELRADLKALHHLLAVGLARRLGEPGAGPARHLVVEHDVKHEPHTPCCDDVRVEGAEDRPLRQVRLDIREPGVHYQRDQARGQQGEAPAEHLGAEPEDPLELLRELDHLLHHLPDERLGAPRLLVPCRFGLSLAAHIVLGDEWGLLFCCAGNACGRPNRLLLLVCSAHFQAMEEAGL